MPASRRASTISRARSRAARSETNAKLSGSICDALLAPTPGDVTFPLAQKVLGPGLVVTDDEVLDAMEVAFREFKLVVEPGGAVALAAALTGKLPVKGRAVAVVCSGGNVDHATFIRALSRSSRRPVVLSEAKDLTRTIRHGPCSGPEFLAGSGSGAQIRFRLIGPRPPARSGHERARCARMFDERFRPGSSVPQSA